MLDSPNGVVYATTSDMTTQAEPQKKKRPRLLMTSLVATLPHARPLTPESRGSCRHIIYAASKKEDNT
jgi:hypothetical protein